MKIVFSRRKEAHIHITHIYLYSPGVNRSHRKQELKFDDGKK